MRFTALLAIAAILVGCTFNDYDDLPSGEYSGKVFLYWVGGSTPFLGDGKFVFIPAKEDPLTFTYRPSRDTAKEFVIEPDAIYTDGGSVPRIFAGVKGLSPWDYGPAYVVHDWLFVAKRCRSGGSTDPKYAFIDDFTFKDSAEMMGAGLKALIESKTEVPDAETAALTIANTTASFVSRSLWNQSQDCSMGHLGKEDLMEVDEFNAGRDREKFTNRSVAAAPDSKLIMVWDLGQ
jgi:hypothetical protein